MTSHLLSDPVLQNQRRSAVKAERTSVRPAAARLVLDGSGNDVMLSLDRQNMGEPFPW